MTEQSPLERAARALCVVNGIDPDGKFKSSNWSDETAPHEFAWHECLPDARAVLLAVRKPEAAWVDKAMESEYVVAWGDYKEFWQAMIDAALGEIPTLKKTED